MGRKPRIHLPGGFYHVILRGNDRQVIFHEDSDRERFCVLAEQGLERFQHRIHAFCLMINHVHLIVQVGEAPLSRIVQSLASSYARSINRKYNRCGHLFQNRYRVVLVDVDPYLLELIRYVHLNPVRAHIVSEPDCFKWSSHRRYLGERLFPWVTTGFVLGMFAERVSTARRLYSDFVRMPQDTAETQKLLADDTVDDRTLGGDSFLATILERTRDSTGAAVVFDSIIRLVCETYEVAEDDIVSKSRNRPLCEVRAVLALLARDTGAISLSVLGQRLGRDSSTLSRIAWNLELRARRDENLAKRLATIRKAVAGNAIMHA